MCIHLLLIEMYTESRVISGKLKEYVPESCTLLFVKKMAIINSNGAVVEAQFTLKFPFISELFAITFVLLHCIVLSSQ